MLKDIRFFLLSNSLDVIIWKTYCKLLNKKIDSIINWKQLFKDKKGLEIGGPSSLFTTGGYMPVYIELASLDGVNFGSKTIWEGNLQEGNFYKYENSTGYQYIAEGTNLPQINDESYGCILSCNNLEHIANPIKAVLEWKRILEKGGTLLLVLPNKKSNFDNKRPDTTLKHLISDFENKTTEADLTHLEEVLALHDLSKDPKAGDFNAFKERCLQNINNRCMHHHVFNLQLLSDMLEFAGMKVVMQDSSKTDLFIAAVK